MKNKLLIPLIAVAICGTLGIGTFSGLFAIKQNQYNELRNDFDALTTNFENLTSDFNNVSIVLEQTMEELELQLLENQILFGDNEELKDEIDSLTEVLSDLKETLLIINILYLNLQNSFNELTEDYSVLQTSYSDLQDDFNNLTTYFDMLYEYHMIVLGEFDVLLDMYYNLYELQLDTQNSLDMFLDMIINEIPMAQKFAFYYQFVRNSATGIFTWNDYLQFQEKIILHASGQYNDAFSEVDTILENYDFFDVSSRSDMWSTMVNVYGVNSEGGFVPDEFFMSQAPLQMIQTWMTDNLHYIYDSDTEWNRYWSLDFIQSPLETMMYSGGDCEDWTTFFSTFAEVSMFETAVASVYDDNHGLYGSISHSFLFVKVGQGNYQSTVHWKLNPNYTRYDWIPIDSLWCVTIGDTPSWLQWYYDYGDSTWIEDHIKWEIVDGIFD